MVQGFAFFELGFACFIACAFGIARDLSSGALVFFAPFPLTFIIFFIAFGAMALTCGTDGTSWSASVRALATVITVYTYVC